MGVELPAIVYIIAAVVLIAGLVYAIKRKNDTKDKK